METIKVTIKFTATAEIEVRCDDLDAESYDLNNAEELKEAAREWAMDNVKPDRYFSDYSGKNQIICCRDVQADLEVWDEMAYYVEGEEIE